MQSKFLTRNFVFLLLGQAFSLLGNYTLKFSLSMYILEQTGSSAVFGSTLAVAVIPTVLLSPFGGVLADRVNRRNLMVLLDGLSGVAVLVTGLYLSGKGGLGAVICLEIVLGILGAFESPVVQACIPQMHSGAHLLRANVLVNQIQAIASLVTPFAGSVLYAMLGVRTVLLVVCGCFFCTALLECFLRLPDPNRKEGRTSLSMVGEDLRSAARFLWKKQPALLQLLGLAALLNFFASGSITVGLPFLVRTRMGLSATWYGGAESTLGFAAILGGVLAGLWAARQPIQKAYRLLLCFGGSLLPVGGIFLLPAGWGVRYAVLVAAFSLVQITCGIFSIVGLSAIQERTPTHLTGKVMAFVMSLSTCAQPLGQFLYGIAFARIPTGWVFLLTGGMVVWLSLGSRGLFQTLAVQNR